jgi:hypothetical protein
MESLRSQHTCRRCVSIGMPWERFAVVLERLRSAGFHRGSHELHNDGLLTTATAISTEPIGTRVATLSIRTLPRDL